MARHTRIAGSRIPFTRPSRRRKKKPAPKNAGFGKKFLTINNPCGAALGATLADAFGSAYEGDPVSAFGGILGFNRELDETTALAITEPNRFIECIIAPSYSKSAYEILTTRPKWKASVPGCAGARRNTRRPAQ